VENLDIHDGLKIFYCPKSGILTSSSYDKEFSGPDANNLESSLDVSSTITKRIHNIHLTSQVLGDINSFVQTRSQALTDPDWVEAMQAEMQQFRNQKSSFLYGKIAKEAPRAWYARLSTFLLKHGYRRRTIDKTLFIKKDSKDIILVQVYVDDIIFGSTIKYWCDEFKTLMQSEFEMSSMGPLTFFLGLQVDQRPDEIFIHQEKYVAD
nr:putative ribonuclease H-like domain-containing protein [Tanacetum cinerariifolium]